MRDKPYEAFEAGQSGRAKIYVVATRLRYSL
jgi:hypothetical protein